MKVMVIVKATPRSEAGNMPSEKLMKAMCSFNEELVKAGVMEFGDGLRPSSDGVRVRFSGDERSVSQGPFSQPEELIAGYWIWNVSSMDEAIEWVKKCPNPMEEDSNIEIRPFFSIDDFAEADPEGEVRERELSMRQEIAMKKASVSNYLFFSGRCEEALAYYEQHLKAVVTMKMRFDESPDPVPSDMLQPGFETKIMHSEFTVGQTMLMASDGCGDGNAFAGFRLSLMVETAEEAHRIFDALADGGSADMPLDKTFWSPLFGMVTDRFGLGWMVQLPGQEMPS